MASNLSNMGSNSGSSNGFAYDPGYSNWSPDLSGGANVSFGFAQGGYEWDMDKFAGSKGNSFDYNQYLVNQKNSDPLKGWCPYVSEYLAWLCMGNEPKEKNINNIINAITQNGHVNYDTFESVLSAIFGGEFKLTGISKKGMSFDDFMKEAKGRPAIIEFTQMHYYDKNYTKKDSKGNAYHWIAMIPKNLTFVFIDCWDGIIFNNVDEIRKAYTYGSLKPDLKFEFYSDAKFIERK
jgi:hypothetical protein